MILQVPGGVLASKVGGKNLLGLGMLSFGCLSLLLPTVASLGPGCLMVLRVSQGLVAAVVFPCFNQLMGNWVPEDERSVFSSFAVVGGSLGMVVSQPVTGYLCTFSLMDGWPLGQICQHKK